MDKVEQKLSVEQGNKLIAEFDGHVRTNREFGAAGMKHWHIKEGWYDDESLQYYSNWNWLMPVIKKLNGGRPHSAMLWEDITKALTDCDIERTWAAVVAYIKWFYKK